MMRAFLGLVLTSASTLCGCLSKASPLQPLQPGGVHVLFIGNSLTYVNDLPGTVSYLASLSGDTIRTASVAFPNFALVDHVSEGTAVRQIRLGGWRYVVLQQGPSSVQVNRDSLILLTQYFDTLVRASGGRTALYSVWPQHENYSTFDRAIESYRLAAQTVGGLFIPGGPAWLGAFAKDATLRLYDGDGLHASPMGTFLVALVMYERFTGKDARLLPATMVVGGRNYPDTPEATVRLLQAAAHDADTQYPAFAVR